jgi:uncharacterized protein (DUF736 family)
MIIGRFTEANDGQLVGHIRTLFFRSDKVVFEPTRSANAKAPSFRIYSGDEIELGAAWSNAAKETGQIYYDVTLDDPTFAGPVRCRLAQAKSGDGYVLVWERPRATKTAA